MLCFKGQSLFFYRRLLSCFLKSEPMDMRASKFPSEVERLNIQYFDF